jgi:hypothetical protein
MWRQTTLAQMMDTRVKPAYDKRACGVAVDIAMNR